MNFSYFFIELCQEVSQRASAPGCEGAAPSDYLPVRTTIKAALKDTAVRWNGETSERPGSGE